MSGHSKWAQIKRQKGANDAKRGQLFTRLGREITIAARQGGGDIEANFRLRLAVQRARDNNMPMENIQRAIQRATGAGEGGHLEEITYEGYGPSGAAFMIEAMTDNRNRTVAEIRSTFTKAGGSLGENGSVGWMFDQKGQINIPLNGKDPDEVTLLAIDAGADDVQVVGDQLEVYTDPTELDAVRKNLEEQKLPIASAELTRVAKTTIPLEEEKAVQVLKLMDRLDDLDDVQKVYVNADLSDDVLAKYAG